MHARHHRARRLRPRWHPAPPGGLHDQSGASELLATAAAVLPEQFFAPAGGADTTRGEIALMRAVLEDAVHCLQQHSRKPGLRAQRLTRAAEEWFLTDDPHWVFSFVTICAVLGLDPAYLRRGLRQWRQHVAATPQKPRRLLVPAHRPLKRAA